MMKIREIAAWVFGLGLLFKPSLVIIFYNQLYSYDLRRVFLVDYCLGETTLTIFVFCLLEVLFAAKILATYAIPSLFEGKWEGFDRTKQSKLTGFVVKIFVRVGCAVQLLLLIAPRYSFQGGLFEAFNPKQAAEELKAGTLVDCAAAGPTGAAALRAWAFLRDDLMAVMIWELAFIPELPADAWLHHIFVILGVALGSDPHIAYKDFQPLLDGVTFFLVLGGALAFAVEACVLGFHLSAGTGPVAQARWMERSIVVQVVVVLVFFVILPASMILLHTKEFGGETILLLVLLAFLVVVEMKMVSVKVAIARTKRNKSREQIVVQERREPSFHHSLEQELEQSRSLEDLLEPALCAPNP